MASKKKPVSAKRPKASRILIANGVNLDLLGAREADIYGHFSLSDLEVFLNETFPRLQTLVQCDEQVELEFYQSNDEAKFLEKLGSGYLGILLNAGAWTHTSVALSDRLKALSVPYVEVHISNTLARETYRHQSFVSAGASGIVIGLGMHSYEAGLLGLLRKLSKAPV